MIKHLLVSLIFSACLFQSCFSCFIVKKIVVTIYSSLPSDSDVLWLHCLSKDDDLGTHTLMKDEIYRFAFCVKPFSTLFHCRLQWGDKHKSFDAYNAKWHGNPCLTNECKWAARSDGIYLAGLKKFDWE
ncbi:hypothetical protein ABFS83_06G167500 [Erythranthe nasuta]